ncbi:diaminopimelate decarboxylase [Persicobacter psychrovividus]|uniref:Diaminopimelate decarboxylase n=1 Tax=Persicobacter psychrovividus TaxID=387638 RepID=A0ABM7VHI2_9BACT|nr:diaminopimelate decarboxylase [Persicobacter psychrovividus]
MELKDDVYSIQGIPVQEIASQFGTPVYVYDADKIVSQINHLKEAFTGLPLKIKYAVKSLTNMSILKLMRQNGTEVDAVSIQEVQLAMLAGYSAEEILFTPNSVSFAEIQEAVEFGCVINIDNISILEQFGHTYGNSKSCCIRLNPHIMAGGNHKISTGHIDSKFGISVYQLRHILRVVKTYNMDISGLHVHTGSDILDPEVFLQGADIIFESAMEFQDLRFIDFGSGFKVKYKENDNTTDLIELGQRLGGAFKKFCAEYGRELEIWFEPGKYLVSEAGYFLVSANVIKTTPATVFVGVNSGMNHLIRPMMYDAYHEIFNVSNPRGTQRLYSVVGYICETDTFGWDRPMSEVREGDVLAIKNAGAYGISMASNYNSRFRPAEVLVHNGQAKLIRKRETMEDLLRNQVEVEL